MPPKTDLTTKPLSADDITGEDILSIYQNILPLLYEKSEKIDPSRVLNDELLRFFDYKLWHWLMDDPDPTLKNMKVQAMFNKIDSVDEDSLPYTLTALHFDSVSPRTAFEEGTLQSYNNMVSFIKEVHNTTDFHYYRIISTSKPTVAAGFFRLKQPDVVNHFTDNELQIIDKLAPHIFLILQTTGLPLMHSQTYNFYNSYMRICSIVAKDHSLTNTECKLLPEILFGYTNAQIAERNFISIPTVKKHLKHIFKKTETKNRMDFIGKFFTSPEKIEL